MRWIWYLIGYSRFSSNHDIHRNLIQRWWLTDKLFFNEYFQIESGGRFWRLYYAVGRWYLQNIRKLMYGIELISFTAAVYLVNIGFLLYGIVVGVIGVMITSRLSETITSIKARQISNRKVDEYEEEKRRERDRMILK